MQFAKTCMSVVELLFGYFLMLIAMTYNVWFFIAVVIGRGLGYYIITPLIGSHISSSRYNDDGYHNIPRDSPITKGKRQPLLGRADV